MKQLQIWPTPLAILGAIGQLAFIGSAAASPLAIWDRYPKLVCRFDEAQFCNANLQSCEPAQGKALLEFDFRKNELRSLASQSSHALDARFHEDAETTMAPENEALLKKYGYNSGADYDSNVIFSNGWMYSFVRVRKGDSLGESDEVDGVAQNAISDNVFTAHMTCRPE